MLVGNRLRLGSGQPCKYNEECEGDLACRLSGAGSTCGPRSKSGDPCTNIEECAAGLTCRKDGRCGPYVRSPEDCASVNQGYGGGDCALGFTCSLGSCEPRPTAGGSCGLLTNDCFGKVLYCRSIGTRTQPQTACAGPAQQGESCEGIPCADPAMDCTTTGTSIAPPTTTCTPRLPLGADCTDDAECASDRCSPTVCVPSCLNP